MSTITGPTPQLGNSLVADDMAPARRITLRDVAKRAGVQTPCASVVINGAKSNSQVSPEVRERILLAADELGYKRNGGMASIVTGRFGCVALLLSTDTTFSVLPSEMWMGIHDELALKNIHLSLFRLPDEMLINRMHLPKILREWMADGMLIDYTHNIPSELKALIKDHKLPAIWINSKQDFDCVHPDDFAAGVQATEYLLKMGHKRIAYVDLARYKEEALNHYSAIDRYQGYLKVMKAAGLPPQPLFGSDVPVHEYAFHIEHLLKDEATRPTAIMTYTGADAVLWATAHMGLSIPRDVSLLNINAGYIQNGGSLVTAFMVPEYEVGKVASQMIQEKIANPEQQFASQAIPFIFYEGNTTAPPKP